MNDREEQIRFLADLERRLKEATTELEKNHLEDYITLIKRIMTYDFKRRTS